MVGDVTKLSGEGSDKEAKHPHDDDQKKSALDSKVDAVVVGSHKKKRRQYTKNERVPLVALICEALEKYVGNKKVTKQIILNHGITPSVYYKWVKECVACEARIKNLSIHCVACSTQTCHVRLWYAYFGKHFIHLLSITPAFLQVYAIDCGWCRIKDSVAVREFGEH